MNEQILLELTNGVLINEYINKIRSCKTNDMGKIE